MKGVRPFALLYLLAVAIPCYGARSETEPSVAKKLLEPDLHFALTIADYRPSLLNHDEDLFSEWGDLVLVYAGAAAPDVATVRKRLLSGARKSGWQKAEPDDNVTPIGDLRRYGITGQKEDFDLAKRGSGSEPPFAHCKIWISPDGARIVVVYRLNAN